MIAHHKVNRMRFRFLQDVLQEILYIYDNYVTGDDVFNEEEGYSLTIKNYLPDYDISDKK